MENSQKKHFNIYNLAKLLAFWPLNEVKCFFFYFLNVNFVSLIKYFPSFRRFTKDFVFVISHYLTLLCASQPQCKTLMKLHWNYKKINLNLATSKYLTNKWVVFADKRICMNLPFRLEFWVRERHERICSGACTSSGWKHPSRQGVSGTQIFTPIPRR